MTFRDLVVISLGNLWRMKLRSFLTISGVLIAIAAFVSMLSFGAGNQRHIEKQFNELGLFTTMQVYPKKKANEADTTVYPLLDSAALERIAAVPGVNLVYPYDAFAVSIEIGDSVLDSKAQALPVAAIKTKLFSRLAAGTAFDSNSARQALISRELLKDAGISSADSVIGQSLVVSVRVSTVDSGLAHILYDKGVSLLDRAKRIELDSLFHRSSRQRIIRTEASEILRRFVNGFMNARETISDTLTICGVHEEGRAGRARIEPVIIPVATAAKFSAGGMGGSPMEMFTSLTNGSLFAQAEDGAGKSFSQVTLDLDPKILFKTVSDSIEAMGYRTFSFAEKFEEIQQFFLYFDLGLGVIGLIALITASLGIVNTMVMSINERRREIGVLKSLGGNERDIRILFLVESGVIGAIGSAGGLFFGWVITRIVSEIAQEFMRREGVPPVDLFALPYWLVLIALGIGVTVSLVAGYYPAARAARIDPVEALRND